MNHEKRQKGHYIRLSSLETTQHTQSCHSYGKEVKRTFTRIHTSKTTLPLVLSLKLNFLWLPRPTRPMLKSRGQYYA